MPFDAETLIERRRSRRRLMFWRLAAAALALVAIGAVGLNYGGGSAPGFGKGRHIARMAISGLITADKPSLDLLDQLTKSDDVAAVILSIDSPGGTTTGGEQLYLAVEKLAAKKPVVSVYGTIATSAAYMISLASNHIITHGNTLTGSVGVIFEYPEVHEGLAKLGIKMQEIKSGPLKAVPSMFQPLDAEAKALAEELVQEGQVWFLSLVTKGRGIDTKTVPGLEAGRVYSGRQALKFKLVDEIGGEEEALAWLDKSKKISDLSVIDWKPKRPADWGLLGGLDRTAGGLAGSPANEVVQRLLEDTGLDRLKLDGLLSVWQAH